MVRWLAIALFAMAVVAAAYAWIAPIPSREAHCFRLTIEADTPDGVRSGSSVVEVERVPNFPTRHTFRVRGEAVFVDLGGGRNLVAVLAHGDDAQNVSQFVTLWVEAFDLYRWDEDVWSGRRSLRETVELKPPLIPSFVTFADRLDPNTVQVVRPGEFERVFGLGVRFRRATLEMVPASVPVTDGVIEQRLPWLRSVAERGGAIDGTRFPHNNELRSNLGALAFKRWGL